VNSSKGDPNALMTMGAVMLGGIITGKPPVSLSQATPLVRLTSEYNVFVLPANSPLKTMKDVVEQLKKDPGSVKWGGGSRGSTEHIAAAMLAREVGVDPRRSTTSPSGAAARHCRHPWRQRDGRRQRLQRIRRIHQDGQDEGDRRDLRDASQGHRRADDEEQGYNVVIGNWRGVYGAPASRRSSARNSPTWSSRPPDEGMGRALEKNNWTPALLTGTGVRDVRRRRFASLRAVMHKSGMI
jgi:putative tricarboxylic transport membrane protein